MSDTGIFATTAQILAKAGANVSATYSTEAMTNDFAAQAESKINAICRFNYSDTFAALDADVKQLLSEAASNLAGIYVISPDTDGFQNLAAAQTRMTTLRDQYLFAVGLLKNKQVQTFINEA